MVGQYMMGRYLMGSGAWWGMCIMTLFMLIAGVVFLLAIWRMMKAKESIANSMAEIAKQFTVEKQKIELP